MGVAGQHAILIGIVIATAVGNALVVRRLIRRQARVESAIGKASSALDVVHDSLKEVLAVLKPEDKST